MKTFAECFWYPRVALIKLRLQAFILCKDFTISFSWNSGTWFSSCASTSLFHFHETQAPGFHPVQKNVAFNFHESQSHVFSPCMHFTGLIVIRAYAKAAWTSLWQPLLQDCLWGVGWRSPKFYVRWGRVSYFFWSRKFDVSVVIACCRWELQPRRWWLKLTVDAVP